MTLHRMCSLRVCASTQRRIQTAGIHGASSSARHKQWASCFAHSIDSFPTKDLRLLDQTGGQFSPSL